MICGKNTQIQINWFIRLWPWEGVVGKMKKKRRVVGYVSWETKLKNSRNLCPHACAQALPNMSMKIASDHGWSYKSNKTGTSFRKEHAGFFARFVKIPSNSRLKEITFATNVRISDYCLRQANWQHYFSVCWRYCSWLCS